MKVYLVNFGDGELTAHTTLAEAKKAKNRKVGSLKTKVTNHKKDLEYHKAAITKHEEGLKTETDRFYINASHAAIKYLNEIDIPYDIKMVAHYNELVEKYEKATIHEVDIED